jgi:5-methylcytosine-specific restriction enzyme A
MNYSKCCSECKIFKPYSEFYAKKDSKDGHHVYCKNCAKNRRKKYYENNREKEIAYSKKWDKENFERRREIGRISRSKSYHANKGKRQPLTQLQKAVIIVRDDFTCQICKIKVHVTRYNTTNKAHVDHIIPLNLGGSNDLSNLQTLCRNCNLIKGQKIKDSFK